MLKAFRRYLEVVYIIWGWLALRIVSVFGDGRVMSWVNTDAEFQPAVIAKSRLLNELVLNLKAALPGFHGLVGDIAWNARPGSREQISLDPCFLVCWFLDLQGVLVIFGGLRGLRACHPEEIAVVGQVWSLNVFASSLAGRANYSKNRTYWPLLFPIVRLID